MSVEEIVVYSIGGALLLLMSLGIFFSAFVSAIDKWNRRYLITFFATQLICVALCFVDALFYNRPGMENLEQVIYVIGFFSFAPLAVLPIVFLLHNCGESFQKSLLFKLAIALSSAFIGLIIASQFTDAFYRVTSDAIFERGPLFPLFFLPIVLLMLLNFVGVIIKRKKLKRRFLISSMVYLPPLITTVILHMFYFFEFYILLGMGLWALTILALVVQENTEQYMRQQQEIANQHASIMVLQMRPHFIYNTMTSIYYLCDQDPAKAKQVTLEFTSYLRKNFAAIASEGNISFTDELEHTRAYLAVEQAQFEDSLFVLFDTPHTLFRLPSLTLQPIVENAVKHGMATSNKPIHIAVRTRKGKNDSEIVVEDDGPGFGPSDGDSPHIALDNIRERLKMMCGGKLEINSREEGGTAVRIIIPFEKARED